MQDRFRGAYHQNLTSLIASIRSQINDPVSTADHKDVVLDHQDQI